MNIKSYILLIVFLLFTSCSINQESEKINIDIETGNYNIHVVRPLNEWQRITATEQIVVEKDNVNLDLVPTEEEWLINGDWQIKAKAMTYEQNRFESQLTKNSTYTQVVLTPASYEELRIIKFIPDLIHSLMINQMLKKYLTILKNRWF